MDDQDVSEALLLLMLSVTQLLTLLLDAGVVHPSLQPLPEDEERFTEEHDRDDHESSENQSHLQSLLAGEHEDLVVEIIDPTLVKFGIVFIFLEEHHTDEGDQEVGSAVLAPLPGVVGPVENPLDEDHGDEVTEEEQKEDQLGQKLQEYRVILPRADLVPKTETKKCREEKDENILCLSITPNVMWMTPKIREIFIL